MPPLTVTARVRSRLKVLLDADHVTQVAIAKALRHSQSAVSHMLSGKRGIRMDYLDPLAAVAGVGVADLVVEPGKTITAATEDELLLLMHWRDLDEPQRSALRHILRALPKAGSNLALFLATHAAT